MNTGTKFRTTVRTCPEAATNAGLTSGATRKTAGSCTTSWSALPATDPHASRTARRGRSERGPNPTSVAIIAAFQVTGAV
jgi:hypothetical protein